MTRVTNRTSAPPAGLAPLPQPPYYAVIFTSLRRAGEAGDGNDADYAQTAERMVALAAQQPGFLGVESARDAAGLGITVSYWASLDDIAAWRRQAEHRLARDQGRADWYRHYALRIARVERAYGWERADGTADPQADPSTDPSA
ncbi:MAG: antibiotic biosynthesis monooxygenase [Burkholderiaceae bacterium]